MTPRKRIARIGAFDALEDRVVLSAATAMAQNQAIVSDVTSFYSNYVATVPALVAAYTSATAGSTVQTTAATNLTAAITSDVNNLGTALLKDLGASAAQAIKLSITGSVAGGTDVTNTSGAGSIGSLMNALLAIDSADPAFLGEAAGINLATDVSIGAAFALSPGKPAFPTAPFGTFSQTYATAVQPEAAQLQTDQAAASTPPTTAQQTAITNDIAAIDKTTVSDVNTLATNLLTTMPAKPDPSAAIRQAVSGSTATSGVTFTGAAGSMASYGSLLETLQAIEAEPALLQNPNVIAGLVSLFAFI
jgi:hypothetical protein